MSMPEQASSAGVAPQQVPSWLLELTFAVQHNPNCPSPWLVRMPGVMSGAIDMKPYNEPEGSSQRTRDALGFGKTLEQAALAARAVVEAQRQQLREEISSEHRRPLVQALLFVKPAPGSPR